MKSSLTMKKARMLRREGYSLRQLSSRFDISKSTASLWTKDVELSEFGRCRVEGERIRNMNKGHEIIKNKRLNRIRKAEEEAQSSLVKLKTNDSLWLVMLSLIYECEGGKDDNSLRFANSDPDIINLFLSTLRKSFKIDERRLKIRIHIHDYHNDIEVKKFWSSRTGLSSKHFLRSFYKSSNHKYEKKDYMGCAHISYHNAHITRVIRAFAKRLMKLYI